MFSNSTGVASAPAQVVFVPYASSAGFTDPSYHLPSFYGLWQRMAPGAEAAFWGDMVTSSRQYFRLAATSSPAGVMPDYSTFDGRPTGSGRNFAFDAWRVAMNVAMDYAWYVPLLSAALLALRLACVRSDTPRFRTVNNICFFLDPERAWYSV